MPESCNETLSVPAGPHLLRQLLGPDLVTPVADHASQAARARGWLDAAGRVAGRMHGRRLEDHDPDYVAFLAEMLASPAVDALRRDPGLGAAVAEVSGRPLVPIRADVCRITFPGEPHGTPAHQDAWYCRAPGLWIAWMPLVACDAETGTLQVAEAADGLLNHQGNGLDAEGVTGWRTMACVPGDVLLFSGLTPHRSLPNRSAGRARVSLDLRFALEAP